MREVNLWITQLPVNEAELQQFRDKIVPSSGCMCLASKRTMYDVPGLDRKLGKNKDMFLFLKVTHFDFNNPTHHRMLRTVYTKLTRNKMCGSVGKHWEVLGFQHTDPRTDINRSGGLLNVLHLFYFACNHFELLKAAYLLAQDDQQNFPLACVSINITRMVIENFLAGRLSALCNAAGRTNGVLDVTCNIYAAGLYYFYSRWRSQKRTIRDTELTFNEVHSLIHKKPAKILAELEKGVADSKSKTDPGRFEFTDLSFGSARAAGQQRPQGASPPPKRWRNHAEP